MLDGVGIESAAGGFSFAHVMYGGGGGGVAEGRESTCSEDTRERKLRRGRGRFY